MMNRRKFMTHTCGLGVATATISSTTLSLGLARQAAAASGSDYRALVCILLAGGNDSYNMVVPVDVDQHDVYREIRTDLALQREDLLPLTNLHNDRQYGLHPGMPDVLEMYSTNELAVIANVGTLLEPVDAAGVENGSARVPLGLFSHADQIKQWQTSVSNTRGGIGWAGAIADITDTSVINGISMNISLSGSNVFQRGRTSSPYAIHSGGDGAQAIYAYGGAPRSYGAFRKQMIDNVFAVEHQNTLRSEYARLQRGSLESQRNFVAAIRTSPELQTSFSDHYFSRGLRQIARVISAREAFGASRQTFFIQVGGWDHHDEVLDNQARMLPWINDGLLEFRNALVELGVFDDVTTFTISDFARTLTSNGKGSDHGWGGHQFVMGGSVRGGTVYGNYPELSVDSPLDVGRGVYVPTTATEEYFAELALWFGVTPGDLDLILPNVNQFYSPSSLELPMSFMSA